jgi:hypothetical protein
VPGLSSKQGRNYGLTGCLVQNPKLGVVEYLRR